MPNDNIKRLLEKLDKDQSNWQEIFYEGYGPNGIAVIVETLTDNINRTSPQIKSIFTKAGGNLGVPGSVSYIFKDVGVLVIDGKLVDIDIAMEYALEVGAQDVKEEDGLIVIETNPKDLIIVKEFFEEKGIKNFITSQVLKIAKQNILVDEVGHKKIEKFIDALEDLDDVQNVHTNME